MISLFWLSPAGGWPTKLYTDREVVEQAELIIVAHIKDGSITRVIHQGSGGRYEHRAILIVSRVIKGKFNKKELPFIMHYGLLPVPAENEGKLANGDYVVNNSVPPLGREEAIRIYEDNPSEGFFRPSGDVRKDQIWLLRFHWIAGVPDQTDLATTDLPGVWEPEDIQPPGKEQQLRGYLKSQ